MQPTTTVRLAADTVVGNLAVDAAGTVWILHGRTGAVIHWIPGEAPREASLTFMGKPLSAIHVSADAEGRLWFVAEREGMSDVCVAVNPGMHSAQMRVLNKTPRQVAGLRDGKIWFLATDTTLNSEPGDAAGPVRGARYNALIASPKGDQIAVRTVDGNDVFVTQGASRDWTKVASSFGGKVIGFSAAGDLLLLYYDLKVQINGAPKAELRALRAANSSVLVSGALLGASVYDTTLVVARQVGDEVQLERYQYR